MSLGEDLAKWAVESIHRHAGWWMIVIGFMLTVVQYVVLIGIAFTAWGIGPWPKDLSGVTLPWLGLFVALGLLNAAGWRLIEQVAQKDASKQAKLERDGFAAQLTAARREIEQVRSISRAEVHQAQERSLASAQRLHDIVALDLTDDEVAVIRDVISQRRKEQP